MRTKPRKLLVVLGVLVVFTVVASLLLTGKPASLPPLPNPNGYDDFVKAGESMVGDQGDAQTMELEALRNLIATNADSLRLARLGLSRTCSVPTSKVLTNVAAWTKDFSAIKRLAQLLAAEGRLAEMEGRTNYAAQIFVEDIRLGNEMSRGGFLIHRMVGIACEAIGSVPLARQLPSLSCDQARPLIVALEKIDVEHVRWDEVLRLERTFMRHEMWTYRRNPIQLIQSWWESRSIVKYAEQRHNRNVASTRLLATQLALQCYHSRTGRAPARLEELVPQYLSRLPQDPFSERPLVYQNQGTNWLLYSVGPDRVDDGGKSIGRKSSGNQNNGDLRFDSPW